MKPSIFLVLLALSGCGELNWADPEPTLSKTSFAVDGVKLISPSIDDEADNRAFLKEEYSVSSTSRLLLRREDLATRAEHLVIDADNRVFLELALVDASLSAEALAALTVCPLAQNWMMLATWKRAHPFGRSGRWESEGGAYDAEACVTATAGSSEEILSFDVSTIVRDRVRGEGKNFGFILTAAEGTFGIVGESASENGPSMSWTEAVH